MATKQQLNTLPAQFTFMKRKLHAWWEGYAFDDAAERAAIVAQFPSAGGQCSQTSEEIVAQSIWGAGRFEPGAPVWTMHFARMLPLPLRAKVIVFGAGGGAVLQDLKHGTRWKITGLTRHESATKRELQSYDAAARKLHKATAAGAISFFELHREADPSTFCNLASDLLAPGAKAIFVEFTIPRRTARLRGCFPAGHHGAPRTANEFTKAFQSANFQITDVVDETAAFLPLVTSGWASWRSTYTAMKNLENDRVRAQFLKELSSHAHLWAERLDAMKAGQLQVTRFHVVKA